MTKARNVALFGKFASGKTTLANALEDHYGYQRVSMAANMKAIVNEVYGTLDKSAEVSVTGRDGTPQTLTVREVLQGIGESVKRVDRDFWLRWFLADSQFMSGPLVMDDARLLFEAETLGKRGWLLVKVETPEDVRLARYMAAYNRKPKASELNHPTETELERVTFDMFVDGRVTPEIEAARIAEVASR